MRATPSSSRFAFPPRRLPSRWCIGGRRARWRVNCEGLALRCVVECGPFSKLMASPRRERPGRQPFPSVGNASRSLSLFAGCVVVTLAGWPRFGLRFLRRMLQALWLRLILVKERGGSATLSAAGASCRMPAIQTHYVIDHTASLKMRKPILDQRWRAHGFWSRVGCPTQLACQKRFSWRSSARA